MTTHQTSTLHTLNKTAQNLSLNERLSKVINKYDSVILIEDGTYQCLSLDLGASSNAHHWLKEAQTIYALKEDASARGVQTDIAGICFISYKEFVELSLCHKSIISWY